MDDLIAFIKARLDEDEQWAAVACSGDRGPDWRADHADVFMPGGSRIAETRSANVAPHIARHDPARALREVAAKRAIVARYERGVSGELPEWTAGRELIQAGLAILLGVIRDLAAAWSDHPDYRKAWAP